MKDDPYADPALYDLEYADHHEDVNHYVRFAKQAAGPVLELGCGTGRLTLPIARAGVRIDGIDLSPTMLAGLEQKLSTEPTVVAERVRVRHGDFRDPPSLRPTYAAVLWPFNALHHCEGPTDVVRTLQAAHARLAPNGKLALDVYLPDRTLYDRDPKKTYEHRLYSDPRTGLPLHTWERGWWDEETRIHHVVYTYRARDGVEEHCHLQLRMFERPELLALFEQGGFEVEQSAEDFNGAPLQKSSLKWVITCRCKG